MSVPAIPAPANLIYSSNARRIYLRRCPGRITVWQVSVPTSRFGLADIHLALGGILSREDVVTSALIYWELSQPAIVQKLSIYLNRLSVMDSW